MKHHLCALVVIASTAAIFGCQHAAVGSLSERQSPLPCVDACGPGPKDPKDPKIPKEPEIRVEKRGIRYHAYAKCTGTNKTGYGASPNEATAIDMARTDCSN